MKPIVFYTDPGHGWVSVKLETLKTLGIAEKISGYSYMRGASAYLEEDCDLSVLANALRDKGYEIKYSVNNSNRSSKIRNFERYQFTN
jgi:hypothetical protein